MPLVTRWRGFSTLLAAACLVFLLAVVGGVLVQAQEAQTWQRRLESTARQGQAVRHHLDQLLEAEVLEDQAIPGLPAGFGYEVSDLSGRLDLNTLPSEVLESPFLSSQFPQGVAGFQEFRRAQGPVFDLSRYADWVEPRALSTLFRSVSFLNPNIVDPGMLEAYVALRSGDPGFASELRARVERFRSQGQSWDSAQLEFLLGPLKSVLAPLISLEPQLNVNRVPDDVLDGLVRLPRWGLSDVGTKVALLKQERQVRALTSERLRNLLGIEPGHPLLNYLGTRSRFYSVVYTGSQWRTQVFIVDDSSSERPHWRILQREGDW